MISNEKLETITMTIIANAGAARTAAFEALACAKKGNFKDTTKMLNQATEYSHSAHESHCELLKMYADGEINHLDILMVHAQDHLMSATLAIELISEIVDLRSIIQNIKGGE